MSLALKVMFCRIVFFVFVKIVFFVFVKKNHQLAPYIALVYKSSAVHHPATRREQ